MVKYLSFHNSSFALKYFLMENGKATVPHTPCLAFKNWQHTILQLLSAARP
jgi:hypothetical protein